METLTIKQQVRIAITAVERNMDFTTLFYSDYMHGKQTLIYNVWVYVCEIKRKGLAWFLTKYKDHL